MQFTSGRSRRVTLDMTPLIDVVLMLVIFFMLTTTFVLTPGLKVDLPQGHSSQRASENDAVVIITQDGTIFYDDARIDLQTLQATLQRALQLRPGLRIVIQADKSAQHGRVVEVMDTAKTIGIERVAIATALKKTPQ